MVVKEGGFIAQCPLAVGPSLRQGGPYSNSPARIPATKADHSLQVNDRIGPLEFLESRIATPPSTGATSTHAADSQALLRRHSKGGSRSVTAYSPSSLALNNESFTTAPRCPVRLQSEGLYARPARNCPWTTPNPATSSAPRTTLPWIDFPSVAPIPRHSAPRATDPRKHPGAG